jgi:hypothetical protein
MKTYGGSGGIAPIFLTSALDRGERSPSWPFLFVPGERAPRAHWIGGWVGPTAELNAVEKRQILPCRESNPGCPYRVSYPDSLVAQKGRGIYSYAVKCKFKISALHTGWCGSTHVTALHSCQIDDDILEGSSTQTVGKQAKNKALAVRSTFCYRFA